MIISSKKGSKVECLNPNTGGSMQIDAGTYDLLSKGIKDTLKKGKALTFTEMVEGIKNYFKEKSVKFKGSVSWYAVTVKHDMHSRGIIDVYTEKGKKLHRLKK